MDTNNPETHDIQVITNGAIQNVKIETFNPPDFGDLKIHKAEKIDATHIRLTLAAQPVHDSHGQVQVAIIVSYEPEQVH